MTEHEDLIAEARRIAALSPDSDAGVCFTGLTNALEKVTAERDALAAVVEQVRDTLEHYHGQKVDVAPNDILDMLPSPHAALDRVKAEARESVVTPEAREHWEWTQKGRQAHGDRGCVCALCGVMERVYRKGESNE